VGKSSFGPGLKAGGPNYVAQFMKFGDEVGVQASACPPDTLKRGLQPAANEHLEELRRALLALVNDECRTTNGETGPSSSIASSFDIRHSDLIKASSRRLLQAITSYDHWWREEFCREHDHFRLLGQDNFRRYLPFSVIRVRVAPQDTAFDTFARVCAARVTGARVVVSSPSGPASDAVELLDGLTDSWAAAIEFVEETEGQLAAHVRALPPHATERIRYAAPDRVPDIVRAAASESGVYIADEPVLAEGRIELLWYLREQSVCYDYHRYGNLGARGAETRKEPR